MVDSGGKSETGGGSDELVTTKAAMVAGEAEDS